MTDFDFERPPNMSTPDGVMLAEWLSRQFLKVSNSFILISEQSGASGAGGLIQRVSTTMPDITTGLWETVPFDSGQLPVPEGVTQDAPNNRFSVDIEGAWFFTTYGIMFFSKETTDRILNWRIYDETAGGPISPDPFPIAAENQTNYAQWGASAMYVVDGTIVGHWLRLELGGSTSSDPFVNIVLEKAGVAVIRIPG